MTEGMDDFSAGPPPPPGAASPTSSAGDTGQVPEEKPEEKQEETEETEGEEVAGQGGEEAAEGGADDGEHMGAAGIMASCCVCVEMERIRNCVHSEKICILPILACLLSLALCTAGLKWVFVDKIFEHEPPTHFDPKRIGQDPFIISADPTLGIGVSVPHSSPSPTSLTTTPFTTTTTFPPGHPDVFQEEKSTRGPNGPPDPSVTLKYNAERLTTTTKQTPHPQTPRETNDIIFPTASATSTTTKAKTSSHVTRCSDSQRNYCVNGGECYTLELMPGSTKFLCRKQRKKLQDRLRQSLRKKKKKKKSSDPKLVSSARGRHNANMPLQDLQPVNCNGTTLQHAAEKDTETTFSTSKHALSANDHTTFTHISSQRFVSAPTSPALLSRGSRTSLTTPGSPPSEMSAPLSSLAISVPSMALSPSGEEERPLLLNRCRARDEQKRTSAHYNHGHMAHSLPPSPLLPAEKGDFQVIRGRDDTAASQVFSPDHLPETKSSMSRVAHSMESSCDSMLTDEPQGEQTPFIVTGSSSAQLLEASDGCRTNPAAPLDDLQDESTSPPNKDPESV
ncbi:pro-neuregulin-1, membrane-bound isoform isoform X3 [Halichoeres trimaculatus]|uniref:pro-neuregulin-1, membrane-bound isoform isoform X3 n=1 Tax=Halichoeres trimaculatus TaxID=147232 RepID=UPI003D9DB909